MKAECHVRIGSTLMLPGAGETVNISRCGVLVRLAKSSLDAAQLRPGDPVEVDVMLPARPDRLQRLLCCRGTTVWWKANGSDLLLALAVDRMQFRDMAGIHGQAEAQRMHVM